MLRNKKLKSGISLVMASVMTCSLGMQALADEALSTKWNSGGNVVREDVHSIGLSDETKAYAKDVTKRLADEGMVLMKNENQTLPLAANARVAFFGSTNWTTTRSDTNTGFIRFQEAVEQSEKIQADTSLMGTTNALDEEALAAVKENTDVAVIVLQRGSSEGNESANYDLSAGEDALIRQIGQTYDQVIVVLNTVCQIASDWMLDEAYGVDAVLWAGQPGNLGGQSAVDILTGDVNPSGKLADTWAAGDWDAYPSSAHWGVDETVDGVPTVYYTDDIYVGYRYFETFQQPVNFAFGYGLSYTEFEWSDYSLTPNWTSGTLTATVDVTNTGDVAGKDVVELYFSYPDTQGLITVDVPSIQLVQYAKTNLLEPGETETVSITFDMSDLALYNESSTCFQMYAGDYEIKFAHSVKDIEEVRDFTYASTTSVLGGTLGHKMTPQTEIEVLADTPMDGQLTVNSEVVTRYYDENADSTNSSILGTAAPLTQEQIDGTGHGYSLTQVLNGEITMDAFIQDLSLLELTSMLSGVSNGAPFLNPYYDANGDGEYTFDENMAEINRNVNLSYTGASNGILERDVYNITMQDRQESVNVNSAYYLDENGEVAASSNNAFGFQVYPSCVVIASTWNQELIEEYGKAIGQEMQEAGMDTWFSPSMNIHRNPAGGRNSEYFSEDPILTGYSAAAATKGVERLGINVTLKHFAANNQEEERRQINEVISERALREIYLKGYEIAIKETADKELYPGYTGVMSSYNRINGAWSSENYDMIHKIAEEEWGFCGWVVTDYQMECDLELALAAGTCIWAPTIPGAVGSVSDEDRAMFTELYNSIKDGYIPLSQIQSNVEKTMTVALHLLDTMEGHTVTFRGMNGETLSSTKVIEQGSGKVTVPEAPAVDGYTFTGWDTDVETYDFSALTEDLVITAQYEPNKEVSAVSLDKTDASIQVGETCTLTASISPSDAADKSIRWTSSNSNVATVDANGAVTGISAGTAQITAAASNGVSAVCTVTVTAAPQTTQPGETESTKPTVSFNAKSIKLQVKKSTKALKASGLIQGDQIKSWKSSKKSVVSVNKKGTLTAKKTGTAVITVTTKLGATAKCRVTVVKNPVKTKKITLGVKKLTLKKGASYKINVTRKPITATDQLTFRTSNKKVARVNAKGRITAKKKGKATITVRTANGKKATLKVTVK